MNRWDRFIAAGAAGLAAGLILAGCAGIGAQTDYDDGFYHWGKGRTDGTTRY
jgi:hypothetical protein